MKYNLIISPEAEIDIQEAFEWYENQQPDLGLDFIEEVEKLIHRIEENPFMFRKVYKELRRGFINRFPYAVYFLIKQSRITINGVLHHRGNPFEWQKRYNL